MVDGVIGNDSQSYVQQHASHNHNQHQQVHGCASAAPAGATPLPGFVRTIDESGFSATASAMPPALQDV